MEKIVIFDMDGVLVDTEPVYYKRLEDFLISRGYAFPRAVLDRLVGESSRKTFSILKQADPAFYDSEETYRRRTIRGSGSITASWRILTYIKR